jgi:hypothetical protein
MAGKTKIMLSTQELQVVNDTEWILTKQGIIQKVNQLFNEQVPVINNFFSVLPLEKNDPLLCVNPKIAKGENYKGLPYVMLDYPSLFGRENIFALRTLFWWGNHFSVTLHMSGIYKQKYATHNFVKAMQALDDVYICINENQWQHDFDPTNYMLAKSLPQETINKLFSSKSFLKLAVKHDLHQWQSIEDLLEAAYQKIIFLLRD